jgi:hypothetical protein
MRWVYISMGEVNAGVFKKLEQKVRHVQSAGLSMQLCLVGASNRLSTAEHHHVFVNTRVARAIGRWPVLWRLAVFLEQHAMYKALFTFLKHESYTHVLMRYPAADVFFWIFLVRIRLPVVFEFNSIEDRELDMKRKNSFYFSYFYWSERILGKYVRQKAIGIVGVTDEITSYQVARCGKAISSVTISNGIDVEQVPVRTGERYTGQTLKLLFLAGSASPWHGVEKLIQSLNREKNSNVHLTIAGSISDEAKRLVANQSHITWQQTVDGEALNTLVNNAHLGVGSMGFQLSFLTQASTLKVREYWARGIPFVLGYTDVDLECQPDMRSFYHQVKPGEEIDLEKIRDFAQRVYALPGVEQKMRSLALQCIDYSVKAQQYVRFLKSV